MELVELLGKTNCFNLEIVMEAVIYDYYVAVGQPPSSEASEPGKAAWIMRVVLDVGRKGAENQRAQSL